MTTKTKPRVLESPGTLFACGCAVSCARPSGSLDYCRTHAAAPDLLAACQAALTFIRDLGKMDVLEGNSNDGLDWSAQDNLEDVIRKATGESE